MKQLIYNAIRTPDGTILESRHRHDYVTHTDKNGDYYSTDGGTDYLHRTVNDVPAEDLSLYDDSPHEVIREYLSRGGRGKNMDEPLKYVLLKDIDNDWLDAIILYEETNRPFNKYLGFYKRERLYRKYKYLFDEKFVNNIGDTFRIIECINKKNCTVMFEDGTIVYNREYSDLRNGKVKNPNKPILFGVGYIGIGKYGSSHSRKKEASYQCWCDLLKRCYSTEGNKFVTYKDVTVCVEWHNFQNFAQWFEENYEEGYQLDKDILVKENKIYSPETCCFVPKEINILFTTSRSDKGMYPIGVHKVKHKFISRINKYGSRLSLGSFTTPEEAFQAYKTAKEAHIKEIADLWREQIAEPTYHAMYNYKVEITD
jgi:hypothetical protein